MAGMAGMGGVGGVGSVSTNTAPSSSHAPLASAMAVLEAMTADGASGHRGHSGPRPPPKQMVLPVRGFTGGGGETSSGMAAMADSQSSSCRPLSGHWVGVESGAAGVVRPRGSGAEGSTPAIPKMPLGAPQAGDSYADTGQLFP
mmetsp:Transcript_39710/g.106918  ORF Transcript_39710/g.106918 Transcript_39710/m.106918 type:complete len:144 (-) Transcript_39710:49-480(-)